MPNFEALRLYGTYYYFDNPDVSAIKSARLRGEYDIFKKNDQSLMLDAEIAHDDARDVTTYVGFSYNYNFGGSQD